MPWLTAYRSVSASLGLCWTWICCRVAQINENWQKHFCICYVRSTIWNGAWQVVRLFVDTSCRRYMASRYQSSTSFGLHYTGSESKKKKQEVLDCSSSSLSWIAADAKLCPLLNWCRRYRPHLALLCLQSAGMVHGVGGGRAWSGGDYSRWLFLVMVATLAQNRKQGFEMWFRLPCLPSRLTPLERKKLKDFQQHQLQHGWGPWSNRGWSKSLGYGRFQASAQPFAFDAS
jgi:hypothetical protein